MLKTFECKHVLSPRAFQTAGSSVKFLPRIIKDGYLPKKIFNRPDDNDHANLEQCHNRLFPLNWFACSR